MNANRSTNSDLSSSTASHTIIPGQEGPEHLSSDDSTDSQLNNDDDTTSDSTKESDNLGPSATEELSSGNLTRIPKRITLNTAEVDGISMNMYFMLNDMFLSLEKGRSIDDFTGIVGNCISMYETVSNIPIRLAKMLPIANMFPLSILKTTALPCVLRYFKWCSVRSQDPLFANALVTNDKCFRFIQDDIRICHHGSSTITLLIEAIRALSEVQQQVFQSIDIVGNDSVSFFQWDAIDVNAIRERIFSMRTEQFSQLPQPIKKELEVTKFQSSKADPTSPIDSSDTLRIQQRQRHTQQDNLLNQEHFQGNTSVHYIPPSQYFMASENLSLHYNVQNLIAENQQLREYVNYLKQNLQYLFENPHLLKKSDTKLDAKPTKEYLSNSNTQDQAISTSISPLNSAKNIPSSGLSTSMEQLMDNMITYPFTFNHVTYPKSQLSQSVPSNATNSSKFDHATTSAYSKNSSGLDIAFNIAYEENTENLPRRMNTDTDHPQQLNINKQAKTMHAKKIGVASVSKGQQFKPPLSEDGKNYLVTDDGSLSIVMKNDLDSVYSIYNEFMQSLKPQIDSFVQDHGRSKLAKFQKKRTFQKRKAFCSFVETIVNSTSFTSEEILDIIDGIRAQNDHSVIWVCNNLNQLKMDLLKQRPDLAR